MPSQTREARAFRFPSTQKSSSLDGIETPRPGKRAGSSSRTLQFTTVSLTAGTAFLSEKSRTAKCPSQRATRRASDSGQKTALDSFELQEEAALKAGSVTRSCWSTCCGSLCAQICREAMNSGDRGILARTPLVDDGTAFVPRPVAPLHSRHDRASPANPAWR